jgi:hypothetical protein
MASINLAGRPQTWQVVMIGRPSGSSIGWPARGFPGGWRSVVIGLLVAVLMRFRPGY